MQPRKEDGVDATNQDFIRYDQVNKRQEYRLAEARDAGAAAPAGPGSESNEGSDKGSDKESDKQSGKQSGKEPRTGITEEFDEEFRIRICDIGRFLHGNESDRRAFAGELGRALQEIGFAILVGHETDPATIERAEAEVVRMFTGHSLEQKLAFRARRHGSVNQGYFPIQETSDIHPDLVEGWVFCRRAFGFPDRQEPLRAEEFWPAAEHEPVFREVCRQQQKLILPVMQSILMFLDQDPHLFDARLTQTNIGLRLNYYPPLGEDQAASGAGRLLGHEDVDLFTLLPAPDREGLQVLNRKNMRWVRLDAPRGSIILNTGDYMQRITNDILPSTTHRVSQPRDRAMLGQARVSLPMNVYLWEHEVLEVLPGLGEPKYEPIEAVCFHTRITSKYYGDDYASGGSDA